MTRSNLKTNTIYNSFIVSRASEGGNAVRLHALSRQQWTTYAFRANKKVTLEIRLEAEYGKKLSL